MEDHPCCAHLGKKRFSGYEYPCILFIKHNLNIKKEIWRKKQYACAQIGLLSQAKETSQLLVLFSTYENVLKLCHKCLWLLFSRYQQRLQPVWGEGGPAPCSLSTSSLPQHTDTACSSMTMQLKCRKFYSGCIIAFIQQIRIWTKINVPAWFAYIQLVSQNSVESTNCKYRLCGCTWCYHEKTRPKCFCVIPSM